MTKQTTGVRRTSKTAEKKEEKGLVKLDLTVGHRFSLLELLPAKGGITTIRIVHELRQRLGIDAKEALDINLREEALGKAMVIKWDNATKTRSFSFGGFEVKLIIEHLQKLQKDEVLEEKHLPLWDMFIPEERP